MRSSDRRIRVALAMAGIALLIAVATVLFLVAYDSKEDEAVGNAIAADQGLVLAETVAAQCAAGGPESIALREAGLCVAAKDTQKAIEKNVSESPSAKAARDGRDGRDGLPGPQGPPGPPGDNVSDAQVRAQMKTVLPALLAAFCSERNNCMGPPGAHGINGENGTNGADGKDAPVLEHVRCNSKDQFVFVLSDGTEIVVIDSDCRADAVLEPSPESSSP